jgi:hypothetical protein
MALGSAGLSTAASSAAPLLGTVDLVIVPKPAPSVDPAPAWPPCPEPRPP